MFRFWKKALAALLVVALLLIAVIWWRVEARLARVWNVESEPIALINDVPQLARGAHLAQTRGCTDCHGDDFGGRVFLEDPLMGRIVASNLTTGQGGVLGKYGDAQLARAIRHGLRHDGRSLLVMPTVDYFPLGDEDVAALITFMRQLPPVDRELPGSRLGPLARLMLFAGNAPWISAETVDHTASRASIPAAEVSVDYGRYVASTCLSCHGGDFSGGIVNGPPGTPASANLTPAGRMRDWSEAQFITVMREGRTPDGRELVPAVMPWPAFAKMTDIELRALWAYLKSVPAVSSR